ncbi:uncharacterized protein KZ484_006785 [Pholidichthys leucotaenia]
MGENVDVKALRARFNNKGSTSDTSSRDSSSPKSPRPGFGRAILPVTDSELANRLSPTVPPPFTGPRQVRFPSPETMASPVPSRPVSFPRPPSYAGVRASVNQVDTKVKQTGEMLQNMMLKHQRPPGPRPSPPTAHQPQQRSTGEVTPLRRSLPPEGPIPLKPRRPPSVNLESYQRFRQRPELPPVRRSDDPADRRMSLTNHLKLPERADKPNPLTRQTTSVDVDDDDEDPYDDIDIPKNESSDHSSQCTNEEGDDDEVYESIDEEEVQMNKKEAKRQQEQDKKKQAELYKKFKLQGEIEVLHTARARHDWNGGGKQDLSVRQGDSVEIIRVKNNPEGKWLARSMNGNYGYISNTCVDIDYEAVKRKLLQSRKINTSVLPPPPPDPPQMLLNVEANNRDSMQEDDDDYDDVQPTSEDFPPPPPEISINPRVEKELRKKFKFDGPFRVLHTMMVDPNCSIKKPGDKDLPVVQGEVVDVIQQTNSKKSLCCNRFGKYGYVSRSLLLPMEGDVYDDVDYTSDVYDNDSCHADY